MKVQLSQIIDPYVCCQCSKQDDKVHLSIGNNHHGNNHHGNRFLLISLLLRHLEALKVHYRDNGCQVR